MSATRSLVILICDSMLATVVLSDHVSFHCEDLLTTLCSLYGFDS